MKRKTLLALLAAVILLAAGLFTENWIFYLLNGFLALGISLYWVRKRWARRGGTTSDIVKDQLL
ncbi:hypothetical protein [uncultured Dysosmobacter sp.]|uniref:hypothetical protein n=1 Tax=uncultured Dysosmobacter sp. TaxID=2591384 RepID=UPI002635D893|nr:hypothetical protein [uncultured Dysosmobacter sp.]